MVNLLVEGLPDEGYGVIPNVELADKGRHSYEYDAIVVTPHAVYVVEIKGWYGAVTALNRTQWRLSGGKEVPNALSLTNNKARVLKTALGGLDLRTRDGSYLRTPYTLGCLLVASDDMVFDLDDEWRRHCFTPATILAFLQDPARLPIGQVPRGVYLHCWDEIGRFIQGQLKERDIAGRRYGSYVVNEVIAQHEEGGVFHARHSQFDDGEVYRIRAWYLSPYRYDEAQRDNQIGILRRSADALRRAGPHPNLVGFKDFGTEEHEFYEVTSWSDRGTLSSAISLGENLKMSVERRLEILLGLVRGLEAAQEVGVFHRNLTPEAILLGADGQPKIGAFDRALLSDTDQTVYGALYTRGQNEYLAPELRHGEEYDSFPNSDLYSVGIIAFELFTGYLPSMNPKALEQVSENIPKSIRAELVKFISLLRAPVVEERVGTPAEAAVELERLLAVLRGKSLEPPEAADVQKPAAPPLQPEARWLTDIAETIAAATAEIWTSDFIKRLTQAKYPQTLLYAVLRGDVVEAGSERRTNVESRFVSGEARAMALESVLPQAGPSFYDSLLTRCGPIAVTGEDASPDRFKVESDDILLDLNGLGLFEISGLIEAVNARELELDELVWAAGATDPTDREEGLRALRAVTHGLPEFANGSDDVKIADILAESRAVWVELPRIQREDEGLSSLLGRRAELIRSYLDAACLAVGSGRVVITSTWGAIYLGAGLSQDVGAGLGASADRVRALWMADFGDARVGRANQSLRANIERPYREVTLVAGERRRFPIGRLTWANGSELGELSGGGMSLAERLLPFLVIKNTAAIAE